MPLKIMTSRSSGSNSPPLEGLGEVLSLNNLSDLLSFHVRVTHRYTSYNLGSEFFKRFFGDIIITHHHGYAIISAFTYRLHQWNLPKEWQVILFCQSFASILTKNVVLIIGQLSRNKIAHVLN